MCYDDIFIYGLNVITLFGWYSHSTMISTPPCIFQLLRILLTACFVFEPSKLCFHIQIQIHKKSLSILLIWHDDCYFKSNKLTNSNIIFLCAYKMWENSIPRKITPVWLPALKSVPCFPPYFGFGVFRSLNFV